MAEHKLGDFRCVEIKGTSGFLIRFGQWLNGDGFHDYQHAHVYLGLSTTYGQGLFIDAQPGGAQIGEHPLDEGFWSSGIIDMTDEQRTLIVAAGHTYVGVPYSFIGYLALALHRFHIPTPFTKKYIASTGQMICSQLVDQCCLDGGVHLFDDGRWPGDVTPGDLTKLLMGEQ